MSERPPATSAALGTLSWQTRSEKAVDENAVFDNGVLDGGAGARGKHCLRLVETVPRALQCRRGFGGRNRRHRKLLDPQTAAANFRRVASIEYSQRQGLLRAMNQTPVGHPVFERIGDKIGLLRPQEAQDISIIYNVITSGRILISGLSSDAFIAAEDGVQQQRLNKIAEIIEQYDPVARDLVDRLTRISVQGMRADLMGPDR